MDFSEKEEKPGEKICQSTRVDFADTTHINEGDKDNPHNWPAARRWSIVIIVSMMTMISVLATTMIIPAAPQVIQEFHIQSTVYRTLLVSIWDLGEGVGPLIAAPLSEKYGRLSAYHGGNFLGLVCIIACAVSKDISMLVAFRFLGGFFLNAPTLAPAIIGDVVRKEERGAAMALGMGLRIVAPFAAPISGAYINQSLHWRWIFWILAAATGLIGGLSLIVLPETYVVAIAKRRTRQDNRGRQVEKDNTSSQITHQVNTRTNHVLASISRPARILLLLPAALLISFYTGLVCGILFLMTTTLTIVMEQNYGFAKGPVGITFIAPCIGFVLGMLLYGLTSDSYIKYKKRKDAGVLKPEHRLIHTLLGSCILPLGLIFYGWTAAYRVQFIAPLFGTAMIGFSMLVTILPTQNYLVDAFEVHCASAVAACAIIQAIFGAAFPLAGPPLYQALGLGWGNSVLALVSGAFVPMLVLLIKKGDWLREKDRFSRETT